MSDLNEIFARDPLLLTKLDIDATIAYFREAQKRFVLGDKSAGSPKKAKAAKAAKSDAPDISVEELDL